MPAETVSVVIPCYNAGRWVGEAIESCLTQTLKPLEVIVVDDGSNDDSAQIIAAFGTKVRYIRQANAGGPSARNAGFAMSSGDFIQFLDADDLLLPGKLEQQAAVLAKTGAAAVFGDWRHKFHEPDGRVWLGDPIVSGHPSDILEALIAGWWVSPAALLFRRDIVELIGGWDETLHAAQDRDFFIRVAMTTCDIAYSPSCEAIYRRYGPVTVGTGSPRRYALNHLRVNQKTEALLGKAGRLTPAYRRALARSYFELARNVARFDAPHACELERHVRELDPVFRPHGGAFYAAFYRLLGFSGAEGVAKLKRKLTGRTI